MTTSNTTNRVPAERLIETLHEQRGKYLMFLRWRSSSSLQARRDPEDMLQDALLNAHKRRFDYIRSGMEPDTWFYRIMQNVLCDDYDFQTRHMRNCHNEIRMPDYSGVQFEMGLIEDVNPLQDLKDQVSRVLALLEPDDQRIMVLIHFSSLKIVQAAQLLGIEYEAAKKRYARARGRFREHWKQELEPTGLAQ